MWNSGRKKEAFNLFKHAASKGSAISALWVGHYYEYGVEVGNDLSLAENYYGQAAKGGSYEAMHRIGLLHQAYASNRLKPRKPSSTRYELSLDIQILKASGQSFTNEETFNYINYGNFSGPIIDHQGSAAEYRIATTWFMKSAKGNFPQSYKKLGEFYELGLGVKQSYYKSYLNYLLAAHYGDEESVFLAELVGDYLSEKEKSKALKLSKERIGQ